MTDDLLAGGKGSLGDVQASLPSSKVKKLACVPSATKNKAPKLTLHSLAGGQGLPGEVPATPNKVKNSEEVPQAKKSKAKTELEDPSQCAKRSKSKAEVEDSGHAVRRSKTKAEGADADQAEKKSTGLPEPAGGWMAACLKILLKLSMHKDSWPFQEPVDAKALGLKDYHQ